MGVDKKFYWFYGDYLFWILMPHVIAPTTYFALKNFIRRHLWRIDAEKGVRNLSMIYLPNSISFYFRFQMNIDTR